MFCYKDIKQFLSNITPFERISIHVHVSSKLALIYLLVQTLASILILSKLNLFFKSSIFKMLHLGYKILFSRPPPLFLTDNHYAI